MNTQSFVHTLMNYMHEILKQVNQEEYNQKP